MSQSPGMRFRLRRVRAARLPAVLLGFGLWVGGASGCGHAKDAADKQIDELRSQINKMQADHDRFDERLEAVEAAEQRAADARTAQGQAVPGGSLGAAGTPSRLRVVRLGPDGEPVDGASGGSVHSPDTDDDDRPRPLVHASGRAFGAVTTEDGTDLGGSGTASAGSGASASAGEAKRAYDAALSMVKAKQYDKALEAFSGFLVRYPDHPNADNALYWRGECFYGKGDYARAAEQFEGVIARFPYGNKVPDALLKLGLCQKRLGADAKAHQTFSQLQTQYPKSDAARQAPRE